MKHLMLAAAVLVLAACGASNEPAGAHEDATSATPAQEHAQRSPLSNHSETRTFGDWTAVCDNGADCSTYSGVKDFGSGWIMISMPAGPDARPRARIGEWGSTRGPLSLAIDGRRIPAVSPSKAADEEDGVLSDQSGPDARAFIDRLAQGQGLTVEAPDPDAGGSISLQGLAAALLWIDERQGRLDTTTALIRKGPRPSSAVPAGPDLPVVRPAQAVSQADLPTAPVLPASLEALAAVKTCRADMDWGNGAQPRRDDRVARLSSDTLLWSVLCFQGAYNTGHRFFLSGLDGRNPVAVLLRSSAAPEGPDEDAYVLINAAYDPETRTISSFAKGRGLGDCGGAYSWTWTGRGFDLTDERFMDKCAGMPADLWPTRWRSRQP